MRMLTRLGSRGGIRCNDGGVLGYLIPRLDRVL